MNQTYKETNKYFAINSVKGSVNQSFLYKKEKVSSKVSDKELKEVSYRWDPAVRQFIRVKR